MRMRRMLAAPPLLLLFAGCSSQMEFLPLPYVNIDFAYFDLATPSDDANPLDLASAPATDGGEPNDARVDLAIPVDAATPSDLAIPAQAPCNDGVKDGAETDVDCGGGVCARCALGKSCGVNSDCGSGLCENHRCAAVALALSFAMSISTTVPSLALTAEHAEVAIGDLNGDGKLDVVVATRSDNKLVPLFGMGDGRFQVGPVLAVGNDPRGLVVADFNHDGRPDVAVANQIGQSVSISLNVGGALTATVAYLAGRAYHITAGDVNNDQNIDLVVGNTGGQQVGILLGKGDGTFRPLTTTTAGPNPASPNLADFDGDGKLDLATTVDNLGQGIGGIMSLRGNGDGTFQAPVSHPTGMAPYASVVGDWNGDGKLDLLTMHLGSNLVTLLVGDGRGGFAAAKPLNLGTGSLVSADFNLDGRPDVAMDGCCDALGVYPGVGDGTFAMPVVSSVSAPPGNLAIGDFNGDGKPDLVNAAGDGFGNTIVSVLLNTSK